MRSFNDHHGVDPANVDSFVPLTLKRNLHRDHNRGTLSIQPNYSLINKFTFVPGRSPARLVYKVQGRPATDLEPGTGLLFPRQQTTPQEEARVPEELYQRAKLASCSQCLNMFNVVIMDTSLAGLRLGTKGNLLQ